jgi:hypothetical protein
VRRQIPLTPRSPRPARLKASKPSRRVSPRVKAISPQLARAYRRYLAIALRLPGAEESTSYGTPSVKVGGKILSRWRTEKEGGLAIRCDFLDRQILLQANSRVFFLTDHYLNYPMILVRLEKIDEASLTDLTERAWRMVAPKKLLRSR